MAASKAPNAPPDEIEVVKKEQTDPPVNFQDVSDEYPAKKRKKVLLKMDVRIVPLLMLLYCMSVEYSIPIDVFVTNL